MLENILVTHQTGPQGQMVSKVFIAECLDIQKKYYFAILLQGKYGGPGLWLPPCVAKYIWPKQQNLTWIFLPFQVMVGSPRGGVDIETVAHENPEDIYTQPIPLKTGLTNENALVFATKLGFKVFCLWVCSFVVDFTNVIVLSTWSPIACSGSLCFHQAPYAEKAADSMAKLYKLMMEKYATMIDINPLLPVWCSNCKSTNRVYVP